MTAIGTPELVLVLVALGGMTAAAIWGAIELTNSTKMSRVDADGVGTRGEALGARSGRCHRQPIRNCLPKNRSQRHPAKLHRERTTHRPFYSSNFLTKRWRVRPPLCG
jgi:hypothetical protein